ncbi:TrkH family potassium uptake protein [Desertivirga xinjiangensis]|uniref:TrkH family potassium uptake protein n=1 Tax=Desertivirga xinjiangensis TaxID=539206 RepID=UPI00210D5BE0|nr:potassium transporter TrkG [Pedobacter xinjiangensis]
MKKLHSDSISKIRSVIDRIMLWTSLACSLLILFLVGYNTNLFLESTMMKVLIFFFDSFIVLLLVKILLIISIRKKYKVSFLSEILLFFYLSLISIVRYKMLDGGGFEGPAWMFVGIFAVFIVEVSKTSLFFEHFYLNPTVLFIISFLVLILIGTFLLLLPKSTVQNDLEFLDALFMSTSAVCVTGLSVIDISQDFTLFGQNVILVLIQLGGLGIMTFTGFFGFFFTGALSYKNQLMFTEFVNERKISSVVKALTTIVSITFFFEVIGAVWIFLCVDSISFKSLGDRIHFSVFHSISAFCNAGFSTLSNGLYDLNFRFNYSFHFVVAVLLIIGGMGFALVHNIYRFLVRWYGNLRDRLMYRQAFIFKPWVLSFNSRLISWTTIFLIIFGTLACLALEHRFTLAAHSTIGGKLATAFFTGVTPRTAGFNTVDMASLSFPTILIVMFLMWIGGSPGSTAGGIKTTTFAVAALNIFSLARGYNRIQIFRREISDESVRRAFAIIMLSIVSLAIATFLLAITDGDKGLLALAFESVSAYSTVGLTLGITPRISDAGKLILIATMFMGRVGTLTLVLTLIKSIQNKGYQYPKEEVTF